MHRQIVHSLSLAFLFLVMLFQIASAESSRCQVISLEGMAFVTNPQAGRHTIQENDFLNAGDFIEVGPGSSLIIAYDEDKKNITRIEENSKVILKSFLNPVKLSMDQGGIFAKLKALPKGSVFEVQTPSAVATVRGSEFLTKVLSGGLTQILNFSDSPVYVYAVDAQGKQQTNPLVLQNTEKTEVAHAGENPKPPQKMSDEESAVGDRYESGLEELIGKTKENENEAGSTAKTEENAEDVLFEMARAYESEDLPAFMKRVSDDFSYRGELEEFLRRDFRDYDGIKLNLFIKQTQQTPTGARVQADWQMQFFPTATTRQISVRGDNLDFIFTNENGKLKLKAQRGANPLFGARSPEVATLSGVSSTIATTLETIEDTGNRAAKQTAMTVVARENTASDNGKDVPVNTDIISAEAFNTGPMTTISLTNIGGTTTIKPQLRVRLIDNPKNVSLLGITLEVMDSRTGQVLRGIVDLLPGVVNVVRTTDSITVDSGSSGTFTFVLDPESQFTLIDRSQARFTANYNVL